MFSLELSRAIAADRQRPVEHAIRQRRLLEALTMRATDQADEGQRAADRSTQPSGQCAPVLGQAR